MLVYRAVGQSRVVKAYLEPFDRVIPTPLFEELRSTAERLYDTLKETRTNVDPKLEVLLSSHDAYYTLKAHLEAFTGAIDACETIVAQKPPEFALEFEQPLLTEFQNFTLRAGEFSKDISATTNYIISNFTIPFKTPRPIRSFDIRFLQGHVSRVVEHTRLFALAYARLAATVSAWNVFEERGADTHEINLITPRSTLTQTVAWLNYLEVLVIVAAIESEDRRAADDVVLYRLESGSLFQILKGVVPSLWAKLKDPLARAMNARAVSIRDDRDATAGISEASDVLAKLKRLYDCGDIDEDEYLALKHKVYACHKMFSGPKSPLIEVDAGRATVTELPRDHQKALPDTHSQDQERDSQP